MPYDDTNVPERMAAIALDAAQLRYEYIARARKCTAGQRGYFTRRIQRLDRQLIHIANYFIEHDSYHEPMPYTDALDSHEETT